MDKLDVFKQQHTELFNRFSAYAPELTEAPSDAIILYIAARQQIAIDMPATQMPIFILLEEYAHVTCAHTLQADMQLTIVTAPRARMQYDVRHMDSACTTFNLRVVQQYASSVVVALLSTVQLQCNIMLHMRDMQAQADVRIVALAKEHEASILTTVQEQTAADTKSSVQVKTVLAGAARYTHHGMLDVANGATGVVAYEQSDHILVSSTARAYVVPAMQVRNHDVQCMHASAIGNVDAQLLWYIQSRGMPEHEARMLLLQAFLAVICNEHPHFAGAVYEALQQFVATDQHFSKGLPEHGITIRHL